MNERLKQKIYNYWNRQTCGTIHTRQPKHSKSYFEEIEAYRYSVEPEIFSFAQFTRMYGQRVLEVGIGAGTDFIQWVRSSAQTTGLDLTWEAIENTRHRLDVYGLKAHLIQGDCEHLAFANDSFDLVYSWGVIHHTPDTWRALDEIIRVCRPGGSCKLMLYNRHSVAALTVWLEFCLITGQPWHSLSWALWHHMESLGTKAFTPAEVEAHLKARGIRRPVVRSKPTHYDRPQSTGPLKSRWLRLVSLILATVLGWRKAGWFITIEFQKSPMEHGI